MNIFKSYTYTWRQMAIFKIGLLALGVAIGVYWYDLFAQYLTALLVIAIVASVYTACISFKS